LILAFERRAGDVQMQHRGNFVTPRERRWSLSLQDPRERRLGSLRLPIVDVELTFEGYASDEIDAFMARFRAHFRRGGG
jgi:hypothetical protein